MKKLLSILCLFVIVQIQAQNINPAVFPYDSLPEALLAKMDVGAKVSVLENGAVANFVMQLRSNGYVPNGGTIIARPDSLTVLIRDISNSNGYNIKWFGAKGDGVTDDYQAIMNCYNALPMNTGNYKGTMIIPTGIFRSSKAIVIQRPVHIIGDGSFINEASTVLFDNGVDGFIFTTAIAADSLHAATTSAQGFICERVAAIQASGTKSIGHGFWPKVRGTFRECIARNWAGNGFNEEANGTPTSYYNRLLFIDVAQPGSYSDATAPSVVITPVNGGTSAAAHAILGGKVTGISLLTPGNRYVARPYVRIRTSSSLDRNTIKTDGWGATGFAVLEIDTVIVVNGGTGYDSAKITFVGSNYISGAGIITDSSTILLDSAGNALNDTLPGSGTPDLSGGVIQHVTITDRGEYRSAPTAVVTGNGTGVVLKVYCRLKRIVSTSASGGSWYEPNDTPIVYIFGGHEDGDYTAVDATAKVSTLGSWQLKRIVLDNQGINYYSEPTVTITGGNPIVNATARALIGRDRQGNLNQFMIDKVRGASNSNGLFVRGSDANAGTVVGSDFSFNKQMGINEQSFLGNTYIGTHSTANGVSPIYSSSGTASNLFLNSYTEGNQPKIIAITPTRFIGGTLGAAIEQKTGIPANRWDINGVSGPINIQNEGTNGVQTISLGNSVTNGTIMAWGNTTLASSYNFRQRWTHGNDMLASYANDETNSGLYMITGPNTAVTFGRGETVPHAFAPHRLFVGVAPDYAHYRQITFSDIFPPRKFPGQTSWASGDIVYNTNPGSSGIYGWQRKTTGSGDVIGTDWTAMTSGINDQRTPTQSAAFNVGSTGGSILTNSTLTPTVIALPNSALTIATRAADTYHAGFSQYQSGTASGLFISTPLTNTSMLATGGYFNTNSSGVAGNYMPLETSMNAIAMQNGDFTFLNGKTLTVGTNTTLGKIAFLNEKGFNLTGIANTSAWLEIPANSTTSGGIRFNLAGNAAKTTASRGVMEGLSYNLTYTDSGAVRHKIPLMNNSTTLTDGMILIWNSTTGEFAPARIAAGSNVTVTNSAGGVSIASIGGGSGGSGPVGASVASDVTTTSTTAADITGLTWTAATTTTYKISGVLYTGCSGTGGMKYAVTAPSGSTVTGMFDGTSTASTATQVTRAATVGSLTGLAFNKAAITNGVVKFVLYVKTSSTSGNITLQFGAGTAGETSTVFATSTGDAIALQ